MHLQTVRCSRAGQVDRWHLARCYSLIICLYTKRFSPLRARSGQVWNGAFHMRLADKAAGPSALACLRATDSWRPVALEHRSQPVVDAAKPARWRRS